MGDKIFIFPSTQKVAKALAAHVLQAAAEAVVARQRFTLALSGGSAMTLLAEGLRSIPPSTPVDWAAWQIYWADERCVPKTDADSNYAAAQQAWLSTTPIPSNQIHSIDDTLSPAAAAEAYARELAAGLQPSEGEVPQLDLVLLGMGEDGHTASLFPGHPAVEETDRWVVAVDDSPKPPPHRITLTLPVINRARQVVIIATGGGKAAVLARVRRGTPPFLPVQRIHPFAGELRWFLDSSAAGLSSEDLDMKQGAPYVE